jgi:hypothetical protein
MALNNDYFLNKYKAEAITKLEALLNRQLTNEENTNTIHFIESRYQDKNAQIINDYRNKIVETTLGKTASWIFQRQPNQPIVSGQGTLFRPHNEFDSKIGRLVKFLIDERKVAKGKMFDLIRSGKSTDDPEVKAKNQEQIIFKLLANSFFGAFGEKSFHFYNESMAKAITYGGQLIIASTLFGFESFLTANFWFQNIDEMANHIATCLKETNQEDPQDEWGEHPLNEFINEENAILSLVNGSAPGWDSESAAKLLIQHCTTNDLWSIILRGNIYDFFSFPKAQELLCIALNGVIKEAAPDKIEKTHPEGKIAIEKLWDGLRKWVAISWMHADLPRRLNVIRRRSIVLVDTDSTFLNLDPWLHENFDFSEASEEDNLTALNIMVYILRLMSDYQMENLTKNLCIPEEKRNIINFKSEFVLSRLILTNGKKNYISLIEAQEGTIIQGGKIELKGLSMKKSTAAKSTGKFYEKIIEEKILRNKTIDRVGLIRDIVILENKIRKSLIEGKIDYAKTVVLGKLSKYKDQFGIPVVRGMLLWNCIEVNNIIREGDRVNLFKLDINTNVSILTDKLETLDPESNDAEIIRKILNLYFDATSNEELAKNGLNWIAIPKTVDQIPEWIRPYIDVEAVLHANISLINPVLISIGINVIKMPTPETYSNIIKF